MSTKLEERYFDLTMKVVSYALEFVDAPGYSSLRLTDLLENLVSISSLIKGVDKQEFYKKIEEKLAGQVDTEDRVSLLNEINNLYIEEWKKSK